MCATENKDYNPKPECVYGEEHEKLGIDINLLLWALCILPNNVLNWLRRQPYPIYSISPLTAYRATGFRKCLSVCSKAEFGLGIPLTTGRHVGLQSLRVEQILKGIFPSCIFCHSSWDPSTAASAGISSEVLLFLHYLFLHELWAYRFVPSFSRSGWGLWS